MGEPVIKLDEGGKASIISYNIPEPNSYSGRFFIDLQLNQGYFRPDISGNISTILATEAAPITASDAVTLKNRVVTGMKTGFADRRLFPNLRFLLNDLRFVENQD